MDCEKKLRELVAVEGALVEKGHFLSDSSRANFITMFYHGLADFDNLSELLSPVLTSHEKTRPRLFFESLCSQVPIVTVRVCIKASLDMGDLVGGAFFNDVCFVFC